MFWLLVIVLLAFLAVSIVGIRRVWQVFSASLLLCICGAALFVTSVFVALTAVFGGLTLALGVDKFPAEWLIGTPFSSYLLPGLILGVVVGGSASAAAVVALRRPDAGALASMLAGAILLGWLLGERLILPSSAFSLKFWWLEALYIAAALLMVLPAMAVWLFVRTRPSPATGSHLNNR